MEQSLAFRDAMGMEEPKTTPAQAFNAARHLIRTGQKLDMVALAAQLGVSRATLYRWTGDRDRLIGDVVIAELTSIWRRALEASEGRGRVRLQAAIGAFLDVVAIGPALQALLENEGAAGLRLLTLPRGLVRPRIVAVTAESIQAEVDAGFYDPPAAPELLADAIVCIGERFLHNGGDPTLNPDPAMAKDMVALLLREPREVSR